ncbi:septal ring lytic transglycosylase RlpA family protein [Nonomuraea sp. B12E4]|uniref:septal ring lytic transglycosylase RlpA family protein n=1 Tax=Nonomuraea sp. B12E4 TaxID=3153564 RepID=UPI00325CFEF9
MGQHSYKPPRKPARRWAAVAAGAAVVAAASTTAWAAVTGDDSPNRPATALLDQATTANAAARLTPQTPPPVIPAEPVTTPSPKPTHSAVTTPKAPKTASPPKRNAVSHPSPTARPKPTVEPPKTVKPPEHKRHRRHQNRVLAADTCGASYYDEGQMTASGERFNPSAMTAAHKSLPMGSRVRVTNQHNGESVTVRINDRGPYVGGRCLDLSRGAFAAIGNVSAGVMKVRYEVLSRSASRP